MVLREESQILPRRSYLELGARAVMDSSLTCMGSVYSSYLLAQSLCLVHPVST